MPIQMGTYTNGHLYKWAPNNLYVYPMKLKYRLEVSLWNSELIGVD